MIGKHYLYRHIRLDKNEPFYVGIGTKYTYDNYTRAFTENKRNNLWKKIIAKTEYEVEILLESDDYEFIKQKEIEFIALYGRKNLNLGTLANLTDGGDGTVGIVVSEDTRRKTSERTKGVKNPFYGKKHTDETKSIISNKNSRPCRQEEKEALSKILKGRILSDEEKNKRYEKGNLVSSRCIHIESGKEFNSLKEGCNYFMLDYLLEKGRLYCNSTTKNFEYSNDSIRNLEYTCYDEITGVKYKSIAEACRDLKIDYNKTRKIYKKGLSRIKSISEI